MVNPKGGRSSSSWQVLDEPTLSGTITKRDHETWPPADVIPSDYNVRLVILAEIIGKDRGRLSPISLTTKGWIKQTKFGQAAKRIHKDDLRDIGYKVINGS
ncbi:hypothetical protein MMC22_008452 [Lobaria immixta]|nr:hypothetical protein [Lobaria immixta]